MDTNKRQFPGSIRVYSRSFVVQRGTVNGYKKSFCRFSPHSPRLGLIPAKSFSTPACLPTGRQAAGVWPFEVAF